MRMNLGCGNSFTISVLVCGVDSRNTNICWRERGSGGKRLSDFELAGDLQRLSFSCALVLLKLLLLPSFEVFRSTSGSTSFFGYLFLTISGSGCIFIVVAVVAVAVAVAVIVVAACRFALRVSLFARFP